ncbi:TPA: hypothetical protein R7I90_005251 [Klebsiella pneumoniae]|uniref:hypothetical protein n=1 Tax=Klebsiella pneumoniae complex TaxID=3390273 RepID=UPI001157A9C7|nr:MULTISPECIES: hypothetical protein [Klebsiella]GKK65694.1 hypothetical protein NUKP41_05070 [Klebsiella variicola]HBR0983916.1 hypothetical protein [Klebsiella pneumoniae]HBR1860231.1 hypothetical protein [Klebsiella pneumoniae]HBR7887705.1 hypothetical protein [Klebsiella pneumoniae]HCI9083823.1 hypothetical protein [Klebsiella variicola]
MKEDKAQTNIFNKDQITEYFTKHTNKRPCQECGYEDFALEIIGSYPSINSNNIAVSGVSLKGMPDLLGFYRSKIDHIKLVCPNCGYTKLYDADVINKKISELYGKL